MYLYERRDINVHREYLEQCSYVLCFRHLPPGLCFHQDSQKSGDGEVTSGENSVNSHDHDVGVDYRGATLVRRYSYNNDPAKYN